MYSSFRVWNTTPPSTIPSYSTVCMHDVLWPRPVDRTMTRRLQVDVNFADLADSAATSQGQEPAKPSPDVSPDAAGVEGRAGTKRLNPWSSVPT